MEREENYHFKQLAIRNAIIRNGGATKKSGVDEEMASEKADFNEKNRQRMTALYTSQSVCKLFQKFRKNTRERTQRKSFRI